MPCANRKLSLGHPVTGLCSLSILGYLHVMKSLGSASAFEQHSATSKPIVAGKFTLIILYVFFYYFLADVNDS